MSLLQPIPAYASIFLPIPAYSSLFQHIQAYSSLLQPITAYYSCFQHIFLFHPVTSSFILFHPLSSTVIHFHPLSSSFILFHPLSSSFILFHPLSSSFKSLQFYFSCRHVRVTTSRVQIPRVFLYSYTGAVTRTMSLLWRCLLGASVFWLPLRRQPHATANLPVTRNHLYDPIYVNLLRILQRNHTQGLK